jgi:hypothetical protein
MITFKVADNPQKHDVQLVYRCQDYSFDTAGPRPTGCKTCIVVNEVQLEYGDEHRVLCVTGYCPYQGWRKTTLFPPPHSVADLEIVNPHDITPGVAHGLNDLNSRWPVYLNPQGWVCIGDPADKGDQAVEFVPDSVAVLRNDRLVALWLHPIMLGDE